MLSVKGLVDSGYLRKVPSGYAYQRNPQECISFDEETIPTIDFSLLTSGSPDQRSKVIRDIGDACRDWGFFMVVNHGMMKVRDEMMKSIESFFNLTEEEKQEYSGKKLFDPIKCGTSFNVAVDKELLWRDYLKIVGTPDFVSPRKPLGFSEVLEEYCKEVRQVANDLLKAISKSLGLEDNYISKKLDVEVGTLTFVANLYPPCPQPEVAMGLPPHSDYGVITLLIQNEVRSGLQILHNGKWVPIHPLPDALLVNTGDQLEILTNGKYKSVVHRAVVNSEATRISIGTSHGPPLDKVVSPSPELANSFNDNPPSYRGIKFKEYIELQQSSQLLGKSCLDRIRI